MITCKSTLSKKMRQQCEETVPLVGWKKICFHKKKVLNKVSGLALRWLCSKKTKLDLDFFFNSLPALFMYWTLEKPRALRQKVIYRLSLSECNNLTLSAIILFNLQHLLYFLRF